MPSAKSKKTPSGSPKKKSPKSKGSPKKSPKGKKSPKNAAEPEPLPVFVRPPPPPPPPDPPKGPMLSRLRRQVWYPYANRAAFEYREWFWSPYCPVITSWGDIWVTDPPQRRILRYAYDPVSAKIKQMQPSIITRGEPRMMTEIPRTGRMAVVLTCPTAKKTSIQLYDPVELKPEDKTEMKYAVLESSIPPPPDPKAPIDPNPPPIFTLEDDCTPVGICANQDLLFILCQPIQKLRIYDAIRLKPHEVRLENCFTNESSCVHLATSGGCAASHDQLFVAATRPPRVQVFWIVRQAVLSRIDRIEITWYAEFGIDRLSMGEPFGIQLDSLGLLVVSDSRTGFMRVYNTNKRPPGPFLPSLPSGETCFMGSWKIDPYQNIRPGHFSLAKNGTACIVDRWSNKLYIIADRTELRWYDETLLALDDALLLRPVIDPLMPIAGLPPPQRLSKKQEPSLVRSVSETSIQPTDEELLPEWLVLRYRPPPPPELPAPSSSPKAKGKKSPKSKSPKSKSPKSKSPKSGKNKKSK